MAPGVASEGFAGWVEQLADPLRAKRAYWHLVLTGPAARPAVRAGLGHANADVRAYCAQALDRLVDEASFPDLVQLLDDPDARVRWHALHALACDRCKETACRPSKAEVLGPAIRCLRDDPSRHVRAVAAEVVGRWVHEDEAAATALVAARDRDPAPAVRKKAGCYAPGGTIHRKTAPRPRSGWPSDDARVVDTAERWPARSAHGVGPTPSPLRTCPSRGLGNGEGESALKVPATQACSRVTSLGDGGTARRLAMTKQGSFKRAVRQRARQSGLRYTEARAVLEQGRMSPFALTRPVDHAALQAHLEARYGIRITSMAPIDDDPATRPRGSWPGHYPWTLIVRRQDGRPWVARVFSSPADKVSRVEGDAEILRFLAAHDFPAERLAHDEPVSVLGGSGVIVTDYVDGGRPTNAHGGVESPALHHELASILGRLHTLPAAGGAVARDGGSEEHDGGFYVGRPKQDLAAAMTFLVSVEDSVAPEGREKFEWLRDQVENADDAEGLPEALTHGNYHAWAAVGPPGDVVIVGWAGSGRGPRLPALAWLLRTAAEGRPDSVEAVVRGYREHVQLTGEELDRLPGVLNMRALWLACLEYREHVRAGHTPTLDEGWTGWRPEQGDRIAAQAIAALRS